MPDKTPISIKQAQDLTGDMSALTAKLEQHRGQLVKYKRAVYVLVGAVFVAGVLAVVGAAAAYRAREATAATDRSRLEARESACVQSNVAIDATRRAITDGILALVPGAETPDDLTPEQRERYDAYEIRVTARLPYRDCSAAGLREFYDNPPTDPARIP